MQRRLCAGITLRVTAGRNPLSQLLTLLAQVWLLEPTFATKKDPSNVSEGLTPAKHKDKQGTRGNASKVALFYLLVIELILVVLVVSCVAILS